MTTSTSTTTIRGLLFGLNYGTDPVNKLHGCINDVKAVADYLTGTYVPAGYTCALRVWDDAAYPERCTRAGMLQELDAFIQEVNADPTCALAWIHYSGHGSCTRDTSGDEADGQDETLVPVDFRTAGMITDDDLAARLAKFAGTAKVVCVMDSCHSGTVCDLKYRWTSPTSATLDNVRAPAMAARILLLSGCLDSQTSADAFGVLAARPREAGGALTGCLLNALALDKPQTAYDVRTATEARLKAGGFVQRPLLTSSYNLAKDMKFGI